jgi:hypothetical protein
MQRRVEPFSIDPVTFRQHFHQQLLFLREMVQQAWLGNPGCFGDIRQFGPTEAILPEGANRFADQQLFSLLGSFRLFAPWNRLLAHIIIIRPFR